MRRSRDAFSPDLLLRQLQNLPVPAGGCYRIAFSGGLDSAVLLRAMASIADTLQAPIRSVHVDHGLSAHAAEWSAHCVKSCHALGIPIDIRKVTAHPAPGESPEAAAREARYRAIDELMEPGDVLVTAHHQDDQAETLLLRLLRGTGVRGAGAMRPALGFGGGWLIRPLLGVSRAALRAWAKSAGLDWIDDPSNFDTVFDRNYLRSRITPVLAERWPGAGRLLARSAGHFAEAALLLDDLAETDLAHCRGGRPGTLSIGSLQRLEKRRVRNLLRHWLEREGVSVPNTVHLERILDEVIPARPDAEPEVLWPGGQVRRYRDELHVLGQLHDAPDTPLAWTGEGELVLPAGLGRLWGEPARGAGVAVDASGQGRREIRFRAGGERCRPAGRGGSRLVKKILQEAGIPPWERERLPLLYIDGQLAAIIGICVCEPFAAGPGEPGTILHWERSSGEKSR